MHTRLTQATSGSHGNINFIPQMLSSFSDFVTPSFSYNFNEAVYTIRPLFFLEWLQRYGQLVVSRRAFNFDSILHATLSYFITAVKVEAENGNLDFRNELQGLPVPTYMQDCHCCAPKGGRNRSYPFEALWVFCPMWTPFFRIDPRFWVNSLKQLSRYLVEQGFPLTELDFNTFHDQSSNMISHGYPMVAGDNVNVMVDNRTPAVNPDGTNLTVNVVNSTTIRYDRPEQLTYNWQTQYHFWWSITCDQFNPLYITMPRQFTIERINLGGLVGGLVSWYFTTRGGGTPLPNFGGSGSPGNNPNPGGGNVGNTNGPNNPSPPSNPSNSRGPNKPPRAPSNSTPRNITTGNSLPQLVKPDVGVSNNITSYRQPKQGGVITSVTVDSSPAREGNYTNVIDYSQ